MSYQYKVEELRSNLRGGAVSGGKLEQLLNERARDGWRCLAITPCEVEGRVGKGGVDGLVVTFERQDD